MIAVVVPATEILPAAVHVNIPFGITVKHPPPTAELSKPIGGVNVTIAFVPEMANTGPPILEFVPAADASVPADGTFAQRFGATVTPTWNPVSVVG